MGIESKQAGLPLLNTLFLHNAYNQRNDSKNNEYVHYMVGRPIEETYNPG